MDNSHANKTIEVAGAGSPGRSTIPQPSSNHQKPSNPGQNSSPVQQNWKLKRIPFKNTTGASPSPAGTLSYIGRGKTTSWSGSEDKGLGGQVRTSARLASVDPFDEDDEVEDQFPTPTRLETPSTRQNQLQTPAAPTRKHAFDPLAEDDFYASSLSGVHSDKESSVVDLTGIDDMASSPLTKRVEPSGTLSKQPQTRARTDLGDAMERKHQLGLAMDQASQCLKDAAQCEKSEEEEERVAVFRVQLLEKTLQGIEAQHAETSAADGLKALAAGIRRSYHTRSERRQPAPREPQSNPDTSVNEDTAAIRSEISSLQASIQQICCRSNINTMVTTFWTNEENKAKDELKQVEDTIHKLQSQVRSLQEQLGNILLRRRQG
ncbi:hypothetical protein NM208_g3696 [Fusarium decemcellulare]|uniref:Uncharacterized protein n=1 Tax=Fusarium decemcellulare TaxID=57161 RepID=A0ACC1SN48_9HYPO|nr:hypothetical protein NM208_g3696 [Fusarium decemcellulare]